MFIRRGNIQRIKTLEKKSDLKEVLKEEKVVEEIKADLPKEEKVEKTEEKKEEKKKTKKTKKSK